MEVPTVAGLTGDVPAEGDPAEAAPAVEVPVERAATAEDAAVDGALRDGAPEEGAAVEEGSSSVKPPVRSMPGPYAVHSLTNRYG